MIHLGRNESFDTIVKDLLAKANAFPDLTNPMGQLMTDETFLAKLRAKLTASREMANRALDSKDEKAS